MGIRINLLRLLPSLSRTKSSDQQRIRCVMLEGHHPRRHTKVFLNEQPKEKECLGMTDSEVYNYYEVGFGVLQHRWLPNSEG